MVNAECLPTEIWLEIFNYLASHHNVRAFSNLNRFFDQFAFTKYFGIHHRVKRDKYMSNPSQYFIPSLQLEKIQFLSSGHRISTCLILFLRSFSNRLINLQKLSIYLRRKTITQAQFDLVRNLEQLPSLRSLEIQSILKNLTHSAIENILITVFSERLMVTHCRLLFSFEHFHLPAFQWSGTSSIRCLVLGKISWSNLLVILHQTRDLVALQVSIFKSKVEPSTFTLLSLRKVIVFIGCVPFAVYEEIRRLAPQLSFFSVNGSFRVEDENYFNEDLWGKLLDSIPSYAISVRTWAWRLNDKERIKQAYDSQRQNQWLTMTESGSYLCGELSFRSV